MKRRIIAAVIALILAFVGAVLVINYARSADERALEGLETVEVLVALEEVPEGTRADQLGERVELQAIPAKFLVGGGIDSVDDVDDQILTVALAPGEQLTSARFSTPDEIRASADFELPEEAQDLHQVTIALESPRALGGQIAPGDTVGVFISVEPEDEPSSDNDQVPSEEPQDQEDGSILEGGVIGGAPSMTHLELHKVLVVGVEGSRVATPPAPSEEGDASVLPNQEDPTDSTQVAQEVILVTLALEAPDAEKLVYGVEFGTIWLSLEPEGASEDGTRIVVVTVPRLASEIRDIYE